MKSALVVSLALAVSVPAAAFLLASKPALAAEASFNGQTIDTLGDATALRVSATRVSGTGSFVFTEKLDSIGNASSHALSFTLKDGGSLTFVAYGDPSLGQGLAFVFTREGRTVKGRMVKDADQAASLDISGALSKIDAGGLVRLQIDVHNDETPAHVLVWDGIESTFTEDNALLNTEELDAGSPGNGAGLRRGFILKDASLVNAVAGEAKYSH